MPLIGFLIDGQETSFDDALRLALEGQTAMSLPVMASIVAGLRTKDRPGPEAGFSASQFQGCARKVMLDQWEDYYETPERLYAMNRGTLIHKVIEEGVRGLPAEMRACFTLEERLHATLGVYLDATAERLMVPVHGQYDLLYTPPPAGEDPGAPSYHVLYDHKNTAWLPKEAKEEHIAQVSIYAWLIAQTGGPQVGVGRITYMDNGTSVCYEVGLWSPWAVETYLERKLQELATANVTRVLPRRVGPEGRWQCGQNKTKTPYCPFAATCWPDGIGKDADGWAKWYTTPSTP